MQNAWAREPGGAWSAPPPVKRKRRTGLIVVLAVVAALLLACAVTAALVRLGKADVSRLPLVGETLQTLLRGDADEAPDGRPGTADTPAAPKETKSPAAKPTAPAAEHTKSPEHTAAPEHTEAPAPSEAPGKEPQPVRASSWSGGDVLVYVADRAGIWADTDAKPFAGAAERIADWADCSVVVVTADGTGDATAAEYLSDFRDELIRSGDAGGRQLENCVMLLIDAARQQSRLELRGRARDAYDEDACYDVLLPFLGRSEYEAGVCRMLSEGTRPAATEPPAPTEEPAHYILPDSDRLSVTEEQLKKLTWEECTLARNEIYARHGRKFANAAIRAYFESQSWYEGTIEPGDFDARQMQILSQLEIQNVRTIADYELRTYGGSRY